MSAEEASYFIFHKLTPRMVSIINNNVISTCNNLPTFIVKMCRPMYGYNI